MRKASVLDPAPPRPPDGGGGGGWAWLMTARGLIEAELIRGLLETEGIVPVVLDATDPSPGAWLFLSGNVNALVRIFVPRSMLDRARLVLLEAGWHAADIAELDRAPRRRPGWRRWSWLVVVVLIVAILLVATWKGIVTG